MRSFSAIRPRPADLGLCHGHGRGASRFGCDRRQRRRRAGAAQGAAQRPDYVDPLLDRLLRPDYAALTGGTGQRAAGVFAGGRDLAADRDAARRMLTGAGAIAADDRAYLVQMVSARTGLAPAEAERRVATIEADARAAADTARRVAMQLSFWLVASMFMGALAASLAAIEGGTLRDRPFLKTLTVANSRRISWAVPSCFGCSACRSPSSSCWLSFGAEGQAA